LRKPWHSVVFSLIIFIFSILLKIVHIDDRVMILWWFPLLVMSWCYCLLLLFRRHADVTGYELHVSLKRSSILTWNFLVFYHNNNNIFVVMMMMFFSTSEWLNWFISLHSVIARAFSLVDWLTGTLLVVFR